MLTATITAHAIAIIGCAVIFANRIQPFDAADRNGQ